MLKSEFSKKQLREAGIVLVIILLIAGIYTENNFWTVISVVALFLHLIIPHLFYPVAIVWFNLSELLGTIVSKLILGIIFFLVVVPVGMIRRISGKDGLMLKRFGRDKHSVLKTRNHTYKSEDLNKPY